LAFVKLKAFIRAARPRTFNHVCELSLFVSRQSLLAHHA
jgi:hypothetical protein